MQSFSQGIYNRNDQCCCFCLQIVAISTILKHNVEDAGYLFLTTKALHVSCRVYLRHLLSFLKTILYHGVRWKRYNPNIK